MGEAACLVLDAARDVGVSYMYIGGFGVCWQATNLVLNVFVCSQ